MSRRRIGCISQAHGLMTILKMLRGVLACCELEDKSKTRRLAKQGPIQSAMRVPSIGREMHFHYVSVASDFQPVRLGPRGSARERVTLGHALLVTTGRIALSSRTGTR